MFRCLAKLPPLPASRCAHSLLSSHSLFPSLRTPCHRQAGFFSRFGKISRGHRVERKSRSIPLPTTSPLPPSPLTVVFRVGCLAAKVAIGAGFVTSAILLADAYWPRDTNSEVDSLLPWAEETQQHSPSSPSSPSSSIASIDRLKDTITKLGDEGGAGYSLTEWIYWTIRAVKQFVVFGSAVTYLSFAHVCCHPLIQSADAYFVSALRWCGPFTIKLGQWISQYTSMFGSLATQLRHLQTDAPSHSEGENRRILERHFLSFGYSLNDILPEESQSLKLLACGSIAQVYRTNIQGKDVILKVRHPNIVRMAQQDVTMLLSIAQWAMWLFPETVGALRPVDIICEFSSYLLSQMDLSLEAKNLKTFRDNFRDRTDIVFPEPLTHLSSSEVLVESFEDGQHVGDFVKRDDCSQSTRNILSRSLIRSYLKMGMVFWRHAVL
jgi:hypothetical protein